VPTYQYVCTACAQDHEAVQSFSDASLTTCPACSGRLRKKFGAVGVVFKGSGFYRNDSRGDGSDSAAKPAEKGTDKPAEKAEAKPAGDAKVSKTDASSSSSPTSSRSPAPSSAKAAGSSGATSSAA
jgi:putative FmdB family regulatory protein